MSSRGPCRAAAGFTLLEVAVVLLLLGLLAGMAAPDLAAVLTRSELDRATATVGDVLRTARSEAVRSGRSRTVGVADGGRAFPGAGSEVQLPAAVRVHPAGRPEITFYPTGLSTGGRWRLRSRGGTEATVVVSPLAGTVTVKRTAADR